MTEVSNPNFLVALYDANCSLICGMIRNNLYFDVNIHHNIQKGEQESSFYLMFPSLPVYFKIFFFIFLDYLWVHLTPSNPQSEKHQMVSSKWKYLK